jgi:Kef-type K+ transport system membrane component KefB
LIPTKIDQLGRSEPVPESDQNHRRVPVALRPGARLRASRRFLPDSHHRSVTALFLGAALSISSVKIVAMVVREMNFMRRDLGQLIIASAVLEDSAGWILIAIIFGVANSGSIDSARVAWSVAGVAAFLGASLTLGRRLVPTAIRVVNDNFASEFPVLTFIFVIMGALALTTEVLGLQTILGAFTASQAGGAQGCH